MDRTEGLRTISDAKYIIYAIWKNLKEYCRGAKVLIAHIKPLNQKNMITQQYNSNFLFP
jgi:hypothetical protein